MAGQAPVRIGIREAYRNEWPTGSQDRKGSGGVGSMLHVGLFTSLLCRPKAGLRPIGSGRCREGAGRS